MIFNILKATKDLIICILIVAILINLYDHQIQLKPVCIKKVDGHCPTDYVYVKFFNPKITSDKDLQSNYCVLLSKSNSIANSYDLLSCAKQPHKMEYEYTNIKINYAFCILTLWFAIKLIIIATLNCNNKLSSSMTMLIKLLLFLLLILSFVSSLESLKTLTKMYNCFAPVYMNNLINSNFSRFLNGLCGLSIIAISYKFKKYEIFITLYAVYGVRLFGF